MRLCLATAAGAPICGDRLVLPAVTSPYACQLVAGDLSREHPELDTARCVQGRMPDLPPLQLMDGERHIGLVAGLPEQAVQLPRCDLRAHQADRLASFGEGQLGWQLLPSGDLLEAWGSAAGTWTLIETTPAGIACILNAGDGVSIRWHRT